VSRLVVVTATTNPERAKSCLQSWGDILVKIVLNGRGGPYLGTVPAFRQGVDEVLAESDAEIIACLHDDLEILDQDWVQKVLRRFDQQPQVGLLGFGGAIGLGDHDIYQKPYAPVQLARKGFRSNLVDAEVHGYRSLLAEQVVCLDGFSQIGRREFWEGWKREGITPEHSEREVLHKRPWHVLADLGLVHHLYDGLLGAIAARYGWQVWYEPIRCKHYGGATAVGDQGYQAWAKQQTPGGDHGFWEKAHEVGYEAFRDVLPLRLY
jgi:hypothetical protein